MEEEDEEAVEKEEGEAEEKDEEDVDVVVPPPLSVFLSELLDLILGALLIFSLLYGLAGLGLVGQ